MSNKYSDIPLPSLSVQELPTVTATELKNSTADVLDRVVSKRAVAVTRHDKTRAVLVSLDEYESLLRNATPWLNDLQQEYLGMLDRMQAPEQKEAAMRAFLATPEELGAAALEAAKRKKIGIFHDGA